MVLLFANLVLHSKSKHVEIDIFFVREKVQQKEFEVYYISVEDQDADIFIKALSHSSFSKLRTLLKISDPTRLSLRGNAKAIHD